MSEPTFRCGWRYRRDCEPLRPDLYQGAVLIRRGEFRVQMPAESFDAMTDTDFAQWIDGLYRDAVFEQLEADLDVLARQLIGELKSGNGVIVDDELWADVKDVLYRWQKVKRDVQEPASCGKHRIDGLGTTFTCERDLAHDGRHRQLMTMARFGHEWVDENCGATAGSPPLAHFTCALPAGHGGPYHAVVSAPGEKYCWTDTQPKEPTS